MPRKSKSGPPYTDVPDEVYVVVTNPWGMNAAPRERDKGDFNRIASWVQFVLRESGLGGGRPVTIECIYSMGTRDEIIIQFAPGTDIIPLLGEHRWATFSKFFPHPNDAERSTCVFLYNWRNNGNPTNHNWKENFPASLPLDSVPAKSPYPQPSWTSPPLTLINFVQPIPRPTLPPPVPDQVDSGDRRPKSPCRVSPSPIPQPSEQQEETEDGEVPAEEDQVPQPTNTFIPYQPPTQHPSHGTFLNRNPAEKEVGASNSRSSSPPPLPKFIKKLDPYELDEEAINLLRSPSVAVEETKHALRIPPQTAPPPTSSGYQPSIQLENEVNAFLQQCTGTAATTASPSPAANVKLEYEEDTIVSLASSVYQPSVKLEDEVNAFLQRTASTASPATVKREYKDTSSTYQPSVKLEDEVNAFLQHTTTAASPATVKSEYEDPAYHATRTASLIYQPSVKLEGEVNAFLQCASTTALPETVKGEYKEEKNKTRIFKPDPPATGNGYQPSAALEAEVNTLFLRRATTTTTPASLSMPITIVKREYEEDVAISSREIQRKKIKVEQ